MTDKILVSRFHIEKNEGLLVALVNHCHAVDLPYELAYQDCWVSVSVFHLSHRDEANLFIEQYEIAQAAYPAHNTTFSRLCRCFASLFRRPVLVLSCLVMIYCFYLFLLSQWQLLSLLTFQDMAQDNLVMPASEFDTFMNIFFDGQFWRLFTPLFLHFDWPGFVCTLIVLVYLGWQIEKKEGSFFFFVALFFLGFMTNVSQFYLSPSLLFSGAIGVLAGFMVFALFSNHYYATPRYQLTPWIIFLLLGVSLWRLVNGIQLIAHPLALTAPVLSGFFLVFFRQHLIYFSSRIKHVKW